MTQDSSITHSSARSAPDANPANRPGVPQENDPPAPVGNAHWLKPEQQTSDRLPVIGVGRPLTPVFSTENPPRGLSGILRRRAYTVPDYKPRHWALLVLADRIDVLEHNPLLLLRAVLTVGAIGAGIYGISKLRRA